MRRLKIKKTKEKETNSLSGIQQLIFEDVKNINKFNIIIEEFILNLQNQESEKIKQYYEAIKDIFKYFLNKNNSIITKDLLDFLVSRIQMLVRVLIDSFDGDNDKLNTILIKFIFELFDYLTDITEYLTLLAETFIFDDGLTYDPKNIKQLAVRFSKAEHKLKLFTEILIKRAELSTNGIYNMYNFLRSLDLSLCDDIAIKRNYQELVVNLLNHKETSKEVIADLMLNLNKNILSNLENPLVLSDYLISIYENSSGEEFDLKILSLSGLFILISKFKLDYPNYFTMLYRTISIEYNDGCKMRTVIDSLYKNRFIKILDLSLKTPNVSIIVILSFIKVIYPNLEIGKIMSNNLNELYCDFSKPYPKSH
jgi:hypothetical protein